MLLFPDIPGSRSRASNRDPQASGHRPCVIALADIRALRRVELEEAALEAILESARQIDIVRLFELKEEREAKQRALQT